ncbi:MAG: DUF1211 domain-containing protein [Methanobacterium sp.]|nr:DUF1211 domain-containing protein [Methanobacterium sp.]
MTHSTLNLPTNRIETLADGIFAIAMPLLVLGISVPKLPSSTDPQVFNAYIFSIIPEIFVYILSFILLAVFWLNHHVFFVIKKSDITLLWINIFFLMSIAIVPFTTSLIGKYGQFHRSVLIFDLNMLVIGILFYSIFAYAARHDFIAESVKKNSKVIQRSNLILPILASIAIIISFFNSIWSVFIFFLLPITFTIYNFARHLFVRKKNNQS